MQTISFEVLCSPSADDVFRSFENRKRIMSPLSVRCFVWQSTVIQARCTFGTCPICVSSSETDLDRAVSTCQRNRVASFTIFDHPSLVACPVRLVFSKEANARFGHRDYAPVLFLDVRWRNALIASLSTICFSWNSTCCFSLENSTRQDNNSTESKVTRVAFRQLQKSACRFWRLTAPSATRHSAIQRWLRVVRMSWYIDTLTQYLSTSGWTTVEVRWVPRSTKKKRKKLSCRNIHVCICMCMCICRVLCVCVECVCVVYCGVWCVWCGVCGVVCGAAWHAGKTRV